MPADFTTVARGYERQEVDRFVTGQRQQAAELQAALAAAERRIHELTERVAATERARSGQVGPEPAPPAGYGARAEKLLRMAESEAVEMRANASQEVPIHASRVVWSRLQLANGASARLAETLT